jgi:hypothetical protein
MKTLLISMFLSCTQLFFCKETNANSDTARLAIEFQKLELSKGLEKGKTIVLEAQFFSRIDGDI